MSTHRKTSTDDVLRSFLLTLQVELTMKERTPATERLAQRCAKKARLAGCDTQDMAYKKFLEANQLVIPSLPSVDLNDAKMFIERALWRVSEDAQCALDFGKLMSLWRFGPGASRGTSSTHFFDKISARSGTVTAAALPYAKLLRRLNPHLVRFDMNHEYDFIIVDGSTLTTVPKNDTIDRTIATEPLWNMALQLSAGCYIEMALASIGFNISDQPDKQRLLAWKGSVYGDLATLDLSMASDLISPALIKALWPVEWYHLFMSIRSPTTRICGETVGLNMMSTMGNGFTFPMMTLTLLALCYQASNNRSCYLDKNRYGVFGDDIIVPTECFDQLSELLSDVGLIVNVDKSYRDGFFRESCGGDYFAGMDITPFYVKSLTNDLEIYSAINSVLIWCYRNRTFLGETLKYLVSILSGKTLVVPSWYGSHCGILCTRKAPSKYYYVDYKRCVRTRKVESVDASVLLLAALGGYVNSTKPNSWNDVTIKRDNGDTDLITYTCRTKEPRVVVMRGSKPQGFRSVGLPENGSLEAYVFDWLEALE